MKPSSQNSQPKPESLCAHKLAKPSGTEARPYRFTLRLHGPEKAVIFRKFGPSRSVSKNVLAYLLDANLPSAAGQSVALLALVNGVYCMIESHLSESRPSDIQSRLEFLQVLVTCQNLINSLDHHVPRNSR